MNPTAALGYKATLGPDRLVIHDVPIFCECSRHGIDFDKAWIQKAVKEAKLGQQDGHFAPLNILHHPLPGDPEQTPTNVGVYEVKGCQPIQFRGRGVLAIFADLIIDKQEWIEPIAQGRFKYRSVEIFNRDIPKIDCLSLLDHEPPFLELPMLMISELRHGSALGVPSCVANANFSLEYTGDEMACDNPIRMVACFSRGSRFQLVSSFEDKEMTEKENMQSEGEDKKDTDEPKEKRENMEEGDGGPDVGAVVKSIKSGKISIADFAAIKEAMAEAEGGGEEETPEDTPAPATVPGAESMQAREKDQQIATMQARIHALEAMQAQRTEEQSIRDDVDEALQLLDGRPLGADPKGKMTSLRKQFGHENFKVYVDEYSKTFAAIPHGKMSASVGHSAPVLSKELAKKYTDPTESELAIQFSRDYRESRKNGLAANHSLEQYVDMRMERARLSMKAEEE